MSCFVKSLKFSFISPLGVVMEFVVCWIMIALISNGSCLEMTSKHLQKNMWRCITWDNINDISLHYGSLVAMNWDLNSVFSVLKTCPILDIKIFYLWIITNNVKLLVHYSSYNSYQARPLAIVIIYNKTKWEYNMTKTTFRWRGELSLPHYKNIPSCGKMFFWCDNRNLMNQHEYSIHMRRRFYKKDSHLLMKSSSHVRSSRSQAHRPQACHSHSWTHVVATLPCVHPNMLSYLLAKLNY